MDGFFLREFLRDPGIASIKATSPFMVRRILDRMDLRGRRVVVEYGPGTGPFTWALLDRLSPDSRLVLIESNAEFARAFDRLRDPRVRLCHAGAEDVGRLLGPARADYVLSGIPFSHFDGPLTSRILEDTRGILTADGTFIAYQSSARLRPHLERVFGSVRVTMEPFHIPPLVVLEARA
jgi:phospholipid N-methyltransferase